MSNSGQPVTNACGKNWAPVRFQSPLLLALVVCLARHPVNAAEFDLDDLPHYRADQQVAGLIRNFGFPLAGAMRAWEEESDFRAAIEADPAIQAVLTPPQIAESF